MKPDSQTTLTMRPIDLMTWNMSAPEHMVLRHNCDHDDVVVDHHHTWLSMMTMLTRRHNNRLKRHMLDFRNAADPNMCWQLFAFERQYHMMPNMVTKRQLHPSHIHLSMSLAVVAHPSAWHRIRLIQHMLVIGLEHHHRRILNMLPNGPTQPNTHIVVPSMSSLAYLAHSSMFDRVVVAPELVTRQIRNIMGMPTIVTTLYKYLMSHTQQFQHHRPCHSCVIANGTYYHHNTIEYTRTMPTIDHNCHCDCCMSSFVPHFHQYTCDNGCDRWIHRHKWLNMLPISTRRTRHPD